VWQLRSQIVTLAAAGPIFLLPEAGIVALGVGEHGDLALVIPGYNGSSRVIERQY
jgi:hypothetical protein